MDRLLVLFSCLVYSCIASANQYSTVSLNENGVVTAYIDVPSGFQCPVSIPDLPTAFCRGPQGFIYHMMSSGVQQGYLDPDQFYNNLIQQATGASNARILNQYRLPEISNYRLQRDSQLLYLRGEQVYTYGFEILDPDKKEVGISALIISHIPNNRAPITLVDIFGISGPDSVVDNPATLRQELIRYVNSYRYDPQWVQSANAQSINFENNLGAREKSFYNNQQIIHQNNMDALDSSHQSYMQRSATSDSIHSRSIDGIHERQQLINPSTGQRYEADGYYDYNYVNPNDPSMSVRTNDPAFNPNINTQQGEYYEQVEEYPPSAW
jgi:hypothetical protein